MAPSCPRLCLAPALRQGRRAGHTPGARGAVLEPRPAPELARAAAAARKCLPAAARLPAPQRRSCPSCLPLCRRPGVRRLVLTEEPQRVVGALGGVAVTRGAPLPCAAAELRSMEVRCGARRSGEGSPCSCPWVCGEREQGGGCWVAVQGGQDGTGESLARHRG